MKKGLFNEASGVPSNIYETAKKVFDRITIWIKKMPPKTVGQSEQYDFTIKGNFQISDYDFSTIKCSVKLISSKELSEPELAGMGVKTPTKKTEDFKLEVLKSKTVELMLFIGVPENYETNLLYQFFDENKNEFVEALSHEMKHVYDRSKKKYEDPKKMALYNAAVEIKTGIPPIDTFIHDLYFGSATENLVRPSELIAAIKNNEVSQKDFISFLKKNVTYNTLKRMKDFNLDDFIKKIYQYPQEVDDFLKKGDIDPTNMKMMPKIHATLTLTYIIIANATIEKYKELLATDMLELLFGFRGEKQKLFERFYNRNLRFTNPKDFFEFYRKFLNKVGTEMLKKVSKVYSLTPSTKEKTVVKEQKDNELPVKIYLNGGGSDNAAEFQGKVVQIPIKDTIPNEPFKDLSYMEKSDNIKNMIKSINDGKKLPPIKVIEHPYDSSKYLVVDGNHRRYAFSKSDRDTVGAIVIPHEKVLLMKNEWGKKPESYIELIDVINDRDIIDKYFVKPDSTNSFEKNNQGKIEENKTTKESGEKWIKCDNCNKRYTQTIHKGKKSLPICPHCGTHNQKKEQNESELAERCWKGYTQKGMKTMFGKRYPNCVKKTKK